MAYRKVKLTKLLDDPYLAQFKEKILSRQERVKETEKRLTNGKISISEIASGHEYFGMHKTDKGWAFREWAPNATKIFLIGDFNGWKENKKYELKRIDPAGGVWEIELPDSAMNHDDLYKLHVHWNGGSGDRVPSYTRRAVQDENTKVFSAQIWAPKEPYIWKHSNFKPKFNSPLIYESHVGMAQEKEGVGTYEEFRKNVLPHVIDLGYNTIQIMALMEHPYYGSFGYHVSNFFAASSRFGTPYELKKLVDEAHSKGVAVIMDLVHSHAVKNELEGLSRFDGTLYQYFHDGERGTHSAWDSRCFDYAKTEVLHFLLSNCRFWLDEYNIDGFRFDGITSMLYYDHGLGTAFAGYDHYFDNSVDEDALVYLTLANKVIHEVKPSAITIAEDVSGMAGLGAPIEDGGIGFDYRLALGIPDFWFNTVKKVSDDYWNMDGMYYALTDHRSDEKTISYVECHDQAIVGSKTMAFELMDAKMYDSMEASNTDMVVERGMALHKMVRLITIAAAGGGYLNFMGNEFGHPEWIDFPREGNEWSYKYARRQWSLKDNGFLKYRFLNEFDKAMVHMISDNKIIEQEIKHCYVHCDDKVLVFKRGDLIFAFNFHPTKSDEDYFITIPKGKYKVLMNSDEERFGGQGRISEKQVFVTKTKTKNKVKKTGILVYLPCRTAMVLKQI